MKSNRVLLASVAVSLALGVTGCVTSPSASMDKEPSILNAYADMAYTNYSDALADAKALDKAINKFKKDPTVSNLELAKAAWLTSRESYGQTEIFRLSNGPIDAEEGWVADTYGGLEGQLNAWPLDENMIDYTIDADGKRTSGNIIDTKGMFNPGGEDSKAVNVKTITVDAITDLNENGGEANVATGYHAVEFLLWGQDQDYSNFMKDSISKGALVAGQRPFSDFTTDKNAERRLDYLAAATKKIVSDLEVVAGAWNPEVSKNCAADATGCYRGAFLGTLEGADAGKNIASKDALKQVYSGMGVFIKSELANERIAVAVLTPSEEDEHSCFSDNTHRDIATNYQGFKNVLMGTYEGVDYGKSSFDALDAESKKRVLSLMNSIEDKIDSVDAIAETSRHFDHQIYSSDKQSRVIRKMKNQMRKLGDEMVNVAKANGISLTTEDVTDAEETKL